MQLMPLPMPLMLLQVKLLLPLVKLLTMLRLLLPMPLMLPLLLPMDLLLTVTVMVTEMETVTEMEQALTVALEVMAEQALTEVQVEMAGPVPMVEQALTEVQVEMAEAVVVDLTAGLGTVMVTTVAASLKEKIEKYQSKPTQSQNKD